MFLIDSHCHLNMKEFEDDLEQIIANAKANNVKFMQTICTKLDDFVDIKSIAEKYDNVFCSVGVHPNEVLIDSIASAEELIALASHSKVIGFGETGLDYYRDSTDKNIQQISFRNHISAARNLQLPIIIHARNADEDMIEILRNEQTKGKFPGLIHCFTSTQELADTAIELGMYISISGIITFKNATALQEIVRQIPLSSIILETDAPYLAPVPYRGKRCEPAFTRQTAEYIAKLKGVSFEEVAKVTTENFKKLFSKVEIA